MQAHHQVNAPTQYSEAVNEIWVLRMCRHRFIVQVLDSFTEGGALSVVKPHMSGGNLQEHLESLKLANTHLPE